MIFFLDRGNKLEGRGAYLCKDKGCFSKALKSRGLERSFKSYVDKEVYNNLLEEVEKFYG